ncbi:MAG: single-stranded-DNA-specific exonuclease RecJ [Candidatus Goldiibacteriota bacterium HGW-Goldbacteria-1]|jgi:single-stranded-DNA-specific exonuclease|nr:MAG: single-stranded-DNA-specific exonuclease RecJ [Candidatus Goldiibacteriota bacterium HGW-Goldbacteria-1]
MKWNIRDVDDKNKAAENLKQKLNLPDYLVKIFINRGLDTFEKASEVFGIDNIKLNSPYLFEDMKKAVETIKNSMAKKERITIYGDYDVDGVTSITVLYTFFRDYMKYENVSYYVPNRHEEGYGLNREALNSIIAGGTKLIITVDCGITSKDDVDFCVSKGVKVIVTDHHNPDAANVPSSAAAIINSKYSDTYPDKDLSGVGTAYKLLCAVAEELKIPIKDDFLDFVALGTIADIVPMSRENRIIVRRGLKKIENTTNEGLRALKEAAGLKNGAPVTAYHVGFVIGPRINAAGRIEHANKAVELFVSGDLAAIEDIAMELNATNEERKKLMKKMEEEAVSKIKDSFDPDKHFVIVLYDGSWNTGIVGLAASKIVAKFNRPAFILTDDSDGLAHGSARSVPAVDIYAALKNVESHLVRYGGHRLAAGVSLKKEKIDDFREALNTYIKSNYSGADFVPVLNVDAVVKEIINIQDIKIMDKLEPWGEGNPRPVLVARDVMVADVKMLKNNTMKFYGKHMGKVYNFILFGHTESHAKDIKKGEILDVAFYPSINTWNDEESVSLEVKDVKLSSAAL